MCAPWTRSLARGRRTESVISSKSLTTELAHFFSDITGSTLQCMKVLLQRVSSASVEVDGQTIGSIGRGLLLLVGFGKDDTAAAMEPMAKKLINMRIFPDERGRFHFSLLETEGALLLVPQFTLFADTDNGRRPEFFSALEPAQAEPLFLAFAETVKKLGIKEVATGRFGAHMQVKLENDGPVTIMVEG